MGRGHIISALKKVEEMNEIREETPRWFDILHAHPQYRRELKDLGERVVVVR